MDINRKKYSGKTRYGEMTIEKKGMMYIHWEIYTDITVVLL
jgi:hypothetical protein